MDNDEPPDGGEPDNDALKNAEKQAFAAAYKAYENAKQDAKAANRRLDAARTALGRLQTKVEVEHIPPEPRPEGMIVARPGKFLNLKPPLPWYHWENARIILLGIIIGIPLLVLLASGLYFWVFT